MNLGYVVYGVIGFVVGALLCYSMMVINVDNLKARLRSTEEHLRHNELLELEEAIDRAETEEQVDNLLMFHELTHASEQRFLERVAALRLKYLMERPLNGENTKPQTNDRLGGSGEQ